MQHLRTFWHRGYKQNKCCNLRNSAHVGLPLASTNCLINDVKMSNFDICSLVQTVSEL